MNIKRNIIFSLESRKKNGVPIVENVPIRMRVIFACQRIEFTTGYRIDAAKWDTDKQRVKPGCTNKLKQSASEINTDLLRYYTEIQNIFKEFEVQGTMPTTAQVKEAFNNLHSEKREEGQQKPLTFAPMEVFGEFIKECGTQNGWSDATYEKFAAVRKHLEKFDKELTFEALDEPKLTSYVNFLKDVEGLRNTSIMKQIAYLKWFLRWCTKKGYCMNNAYESFNPKLKSVQKKVIFLTWEELNKLNELTGIPVDSLQTALDREERSHVELEDDYIFVVVNTPVVLETDAYDALPLGIFITRQFFVTVCLENNSVIQKFLNNSFTSFQTYKKTRFLFQILSQASSSFLFFLQQIYKQTDVIETQVRKSLQNKELFRMLELQKSLTYFNFALHANENVMERLMRLRNSPLHSLLKMYEEDEDLLEDVIIENKQALEMAEIYTNILMSMMDSFSSIISNRLSQIMKFLTSVTIILAIPTLIFSLWGINVPVPWADAPLGFAEVILIGILVTMVATFVLWKKDML